MDVMQSPTPTYVSETTDKGARFARSKVALTLAGVSLAWSTALTPGIPQANASTRPFAMRSTRHGRGGGTMDRGVTNNGQIVMAAPQATAPIAAPSAGLYFEIGPAETIEQIAARHRAHRARSRARSETLIDADIPILEDGADW